MGIEMLINAVLKAMGYRKDDFDKGVEYAKTEFELFRRRAEDSERRLVDVQSDLLATRESLQRIEILLAAREVENAN